MEVVADEISGIIYLPPEVLENIFADPVLGVKDLCSLCQTCSLFRDVLVANSLWRAKFCQRWPILCREVERRKPLSENLTDVNWKSITHQRILVKKTVIRRLEDMARDTRKRYVKYQKATDESMLYNFCELLPPEVNPKLQTVFIVNELRRILCRGHDWENLTGKYYAEKSLWFFHHQSLLPEIEQFMATSLDKQDIEVGAAIIAQWFQPRTVFTVQDIKNEFNLLADFTKEALRTINPDHSVFSYKTEIVVESHSLWCPVECRQILQAIEIICKSSFNKGFDSYYTPSNSFINVVLHKKEGIPITLCLTVMSIAKRLGLVLEPVNFPHHFILRWMEFPSKYGIDKYSFIDVFGGSYSMRFQNLVDSYSMGGSTLIVEAHCNRCTHQEVLHRMLRNLLNLGGHRRTDYGLDLLHHSVELSILLTPHDIELAILSAQVSLHLKINIPKALSRIQEAAGSDNAQTDVLIDLQVQCEHLLLHMQRLKEEEDVSISSRVKWRIDHVQVMFAVGMIMQHKKYNYLCVITGWDDKCQASEQWIKQMNVDKCQRGRMQPFYNVWVMDGSNRYAAEENLVLTRETVMIKHPEVGRLFQTFTGRFYIPGPQLLTEYPDDLKVTQDLVTQFFEEHP